ncbi:MAG: diguanylate cyclase, partial [Lachnospiraceae bacterium]|nr:diguanylate cyclase [Lachnospiraceae bacterium]
GEEFLVMLTGIEPRQALQWTLMLKKRIEDLKISHASDNFLPYVTVSMGLACCQTGQGRSFEQIREEADRALYDAKYSGRACLSYNKKIYAQLNAYQYRKRANA